MPPGRKGKHVPEHENDVSQDNIAEVLAKEAEDTERGRDMDATYVPSRRRPKDPSQVYSVRLPVERLEELRQLAARQDVAPSALLRRWTIERIDREIDHDSRVAEERERRHLDSDDVLIMTRGQLESEIHRVLMERSDTIIRLLRESRE
jgi:hypothetical protein